MAPEPESPEVEETMEAFTEDGKKRVLITHFKDKITSICTSFDEKPISCHSSPDEKKELFYISQAWFADLGFKIRKIE
jgi:hypothetical protein